ncbi:putative thiamine-phosphate synthase [Agaricicola taiwanensis]|uniref:Putative thiamine-phosphate synthase n=1 Tax=Agaricicola taiwanensis TaxID=591372 RepID=A0A8J2YI72_9RHOB|nr:thiamine phosphate synthase [Agaricicola taiwanensis]GGE44658.1 putative thiamine-phosphate synthase [Agaricicola taiwanensis]
MTDLPQPPLLLITDRHQAVRPLHEIAEAAFSAGCRWLSIREKDLPASDLQALVADLMVVGERYGARIGLHGTADQARALGVGAVHLASGSDVTAARRTMGPEALVGISIHSADDAAEVDPLLADYAVIGPAFVTRSKPGYGPALETAGIAAAARRSRVPLLAVGGIDMNNAAGMFPAGAAGICVMGGIMRAPDPARDIGCLVTAIGGQRGR